MITRKDRLFMEMTTHAAGQFSTCSKRQYHAIIVDSYGHIIGTGYNGGPKGFGHCNEGHCPRAQQGTASGSNYDNCIAIHAEANALLHSDYTARHGATIYVNGSPCFACAKLVANSGINRIVYVSDPTYATEADVISFLNQSNINTEAINASE